MKINIAFINASTKVSDKEAELVMKHLQIQMDRDFSPVWNVGCTLTFYPTGRKPPVEYWWLSVLDDSDQAGDLGYHDITTAGLPLGKIFAGTDIKYGAAWSVTASHELMEMLVDPYINLTVFNQTSNNAGSIYAYEVADACEDDKFSYAIGSVRVSDFVYPSWFDGWRVANSVKFDFKDHITAPFALLSGGYIGVFQANGAGWTQITAEKTFAAPETIPAGCRRNRRAKNRTDWKHSTVAMDHAPTTPDAS